MFKEDKKLKIAFIHPDLGIGGAERLVVDAAIGLQEKGHEVIIYTSHCDKTHCFEEVSKGLLNVEVFGDHLPTNVAGRFFIVFATFRQLYLLLKLTFSHKISNHDLYIIDQLSTCLPFLHMLSKAKTLFYCHFPDQLLATRSSLIKRLYRFPFDMIEQFSMGTADYVVVNSNFTRSVYQNTFKYLRKIPNVIYPCVDLNFQDEDEKDRKLVDYILKPEDTFYLSVNRYERKKNIELALKAFAMSTEISNVNAKLIICGGYDERVTENVEYLRDLQKMSDVLGISHGTIFYPQLNDFEELHVPDISTKKVIFLTSISTSLKEYLLRKMELLLYTPSFEHFGIVPLEAMKYGKPVLAVNTGGPLETVESFISEKNEQSATGWLRRPDPKDWSEAIDEYKKVMNNKTVNFAENGPIRVRRLFSREAMTESFESNIRSFIDLKRNDYIWEILVGAIFNLLLQIAISNVFVGSSWPYLAMAVISIFCFESLRFSIYWVCIYFGSWIL